MTESSIPAGAHIGHVHLKVADLERAIWFYRDLMGFDIVVRDGDEAAFLAAGDYHCAAHERRGSVCGAGPGEHTEGPRDSRR